MSLSSLQAPWTGGHERQLNQKSLLLHATGEQVDVENVCSIFDGDGGDEVIKKLSDVMLRRSVKDEKAKK